MGKLVDFVQNYFAAQKKPTEKIWSFGNTNNNNWSFWKNFVKPHLGDLSYMNNLKHLSHLSHLSHFSNFNNNGNWWNTNWNTNSNSKQDNNWWNTNWNTNSNSKQDNNWWYTNWNTNINSKQDSPAEESMLTIYHKMTVDNHTREGVTKVPSSELMPFMRTVWNSLSRDSHMPLGIGAFLPFLGIILPFVIMAAVIPMIFFIMLSVFGMMSGILVLLPLMLTGLLGSENTFPIEKMIEEMFLEEFVGSENVNKIFEAIEKVDKENIVYDEEDTTVGQEEDQVPRFLSF